MKSSWPKCPKCRSQNVELIEIWSATISWIPNDPDFENGKGILTPGDPEKVEGRCLKCEHRWRIRNVVQVQLEWFEVTK